MNPNYTVILFSGGTDSTLAAALMADKFEKIFLVTFDRYGFFSIENTKLNAQKLAEKYGRDKFIHQIINIDRLTQYVFYERYLHNIFQHGFFLLSICGLCKLAMHIAAIVFCIEHKIGHVCDGANQGMSLFPAQMRDVIKEIKHMYADFHIDYSNPVYDFDSPPDAGFLDRLHFDRVLSNTQDAVPGEEAVGKTTGCQLYALGLMPSEIVKGTALDRKMQARCFQFILFNIFVQWYYLYDHSYDEYVKATCRFYKEKIVHLTDIIKEYEQAGSQSKLYKLLHRR